MPVRQVFVAYATALALAAFSPRPGLAYSIDCALLLCLPGGFPASEPCDRAHAEMIRRITPWPIEPPLQLWNCPLNAGIGAVSPTGSSPGDAVRSYQRGIEVWQISKRSTNSSGGRDSEASALRNYYDESGSFRRMGVTALAVPAWVAEQVRVHTGTSLVSDYGSFNAILMRYHDHEGTPFYEWVRY